MKSKIFNSEKVEGRVYEHTLAVKQVQNTESANFGKDFISGSIDVATDEECLNIVTVVFSYVTETTKQGKKNDTYTALKTIIDAGKTALHDSAEEATKVSIDTSLGVNDFYTSRNGQEELVTAKRNEGGFVHIVNKLNPDVEKRNAFECDMLIMGTRLVEADEERNIAEDYLILKGIVMNFRKDFLPVELIVKMPGGIKYFESLDASTSNPVFTKVWGRINSETIKTIKEEESAFGEAVVKEYARSIKEWVVTGTAKEVYEIDSAQNGITMEEIKKGFSDRETHLAEVKKRNDAYLASKGTKSAPAGAGVSASQGGFNF